MSSVPADADKFPVLDWYVIERRPSKFVPGQQAIVTKLKCPGCEALHYTPGIDTMLTCPCGLSFQYDMAHLHVWRADRVRT